MVSNIFTHILSGGVNLRKYKMVLLPYRQGKSYPKLFYTNKTYR
jgi:hypothetical protein